MVIKAHDEHIDTLIARFLDKSASAAEEQELLAWVRSSKDNELYYIALHKIYTTAQMQQQLDFDTSAELDACMAKAGIEKGKSRKLFYTVASVAASVALLVGAFWAFNPFAHKDSLQAANQLGKKYQSADSQLVATLDDHSTVTLAGHSTIVSQPSCDTLRKQVLQGRAYFEVAHDKTRPFVVDVDFVEVRVLGTKFEIKQNPLDSSVRVSVTEGKVLVTNLLTKRRDTLTANQQCTLLKNGQTLHVALCNQNFLAWKTGVLEFNQTPLVDAVADLGDYYGKSFRLSSPGLDSCLLRASFHNKTIREVKSVLEIALGAKLVENDSLITIVAKPCN